MTVEWVRRRPAVLAKIPPRIANFDAAALIGHRFLLESALLDQNLKGAFDALEKQETIREHQTLHGITLSDNWIPQWWEGDVELELFEIGVWTNDDTIQVIVVYIITADDHATSKKRELHYVYKGSGDDVGYAAHNINSGARMETDQEQWTFLKLAGQTLSGPPERIKWKDVLGFQFEKWGDTEWRIDALAIRGWDRFGFLVDFTGGKVDTNLFIRGAQPGSQTFSAIKPPGPVPAALPPPNRSPEKSLTSEERHQINKLLDHFSRNKDYYNRVILLSTDPTSIAIQFEEPPGWLADNVDPYPLEVSGSYVAYPLGKVTGGFAVAAEKSERLMTLPTRGVFAEGKLGHCNISEVIDPDRFWKWEEHPIPFEAPGINPVTPITPQPQQTNIAPTPFPQSLVNIVNPSPAPDPTGLAAALNVLGTPNIFRDMSGRAEVADLLKKLSDNSVSIAQAANKAREIQNKYGDNLLKTPSDTGSTPVGQPKTPTVQPQPTPTPEQREQQHLDNQDKKLDIADRLPKPQKDEVRKDVVKEVTKKKKPWKVSFASEWAGETIKQPMKASYVGELVFGAKGDTVLLNTLTTDQVAVWEVESEKTPLALSMIAFEVEPFTGGFSIAVPGITVEGLTLKETTYNVPLRSEASYLPGELKAAVAKIQIKDNETTLYFQGTGKIGKKD